MGLEVESVEDVLNEMTNLQRFLPLRPSAEEYQAALFAVARADNVLATRLEELVRQKRPEKVPQPMFRALQEMREDVLRMQVQEQKRPQLSVIELEERHRRYDQLIQKVRAGLMSGMNGTLNGSPVADEMESSSLGELEEVQENGYYTAGPRQVADVRENGSRFYTSDNVAPMVSEITSVSPRSSSPTYTVRHGVPVAVDNSTTAVNNFAPDTPTAHKGLSTIDEDGQGGQYPPKLLAIIQAAAEQGSDTLDISEMFNAQNLWLPETIGQLTNLRILDMSGNRIVKLPDSIGDLSQLTVLNLQSNQLTALPDTLGKLTNLKKLYIEKNAIEELPWTIGNCEALEELRADFNQLKALPEAVGYLGNLKVLSVHLNCIKGLPTTMAYLTSLTELDVHFNQLESVPESISFVTTLRKLDISSNFHALRSLPYKIGNLQQLVDLDISYNSLQELPDSFVLLTNLQKLQLDGNPWRVPPLQVTQQGKQAIFEYMEDRIRIKQQEKLARQNRSFATKIFQACFGCIKRCCCEQQRAEDSGLNILA